MSIYKICKHEVVTVDKDQSMTEVARLMRNRHIGFVCVMQANKPIGVLSDRDIVIKIIDKQVSPNAISVEAAMCIEPLLLNTQTCLLDALRRMSERGVRRTPVVNDEGFLVGIVSIDDVIKQISEELQMLAILIQAEQYNGQQKIAMALT